MGNMDESRHVERIEQEQTSSAGWQTQRLPDLSRGAPGRTGLAQPAMGPSPLTRGRNHAAGVALIVMGLLFWLGRGVPDQDAVTAGMILLTIASPFLFVAFWRRIYPLLIPGCILAGLSMGIPLAPLTNGISIMWGLALGFVAIYVLGCELFNVRRSWPLFPAIPLFSIGVIIAIATLPTFLAAGFMWLPLLLIGAGLYLGWGRQAP